MYFIKQQLNIRSTTIIIRNITNPMEFLSISRTHSIAEKGNKRGGERVKRGEEEREKGRGRKREGEREKERRGEREKDIPLLSLLLLFFGLFSLLFLLFLLLLSEPLSDSDDCQKETLHVFLFSYFITVLMRYIQSVEYVNNTNTFPIKY